MKTESFTSVLLGGIRGYRESARLHREAAARALEQEDAARAILEQQWATQAEQWAEEDERKLATL